MLKSKKEKFKEYEAEKQSAFIEISRQSVDAILRMKELLDQISKNFFESDFFNSIEHLHSVINEKFNEIRKRQDEQEGALNKILEEVSYLSDKINDDFMHQLSDVSNHLGRMMENLVVSLDKLFEKLNSLEARIDSLEKSQKEKSSASKNIYPL